MTDDIKQSFGTKATTKKAGRPKKTTASSDKPKQDERKSIFALGDYVMMHNLLMDHDAQKRFIKDIKDGVIKLTPAQLNYIKKLLNI